MPHSFLPQIPLTEEQAAKLARDARLAGLGTVDYVRKVLFDVLPAPTPKAAKVKKDGGKSGKTVMEQKTARKGGARDSG
jgi:hypothetical protein